MIGPITAIDNKGKKRGAGYIRSIENGKEKN
jgi:hypothetical protein